MAVDIKLRSIKKQEQNEENFNIKSFLCRKTEVENIMDND